MSQPLQRYLPERDPHKIDRIIGPTEDTPTNTTNLTHRSPAGDEQRLRAIPVSVQGVAGVIPGTNPHAALEAKERNRQRFTHKRINRA